jgi:hypothetical protein
MGILPRAKFISNMIMNVIAVCTAAACSILTSYCTTLARKHTTPTPSSSATSATGVAASSASLLYNSSASVVAAVWLFFWVSTIRTLLYTYLAYATLDLRHQCYQSEDATGQIRSHSVLN